MDEGGGTASPDARERLRARLASGPPLLLDGATGTELEAAGLACPAPLWSTHALLERPDLVREVHRRYARAGAEVLTAATFRTQAHCLAKRGLADRAAALTALAVELAREAAEGEGGRRWVAGSLAPLEDCYRPERAPEPARLAAGHRQQARALATAGVDLILVESLGTLREVRAAGRAAAETGLPFMLSVISWQPGRLLSGEPLAEALACARDLAPEALLLNCMPPSAAAAGLQRLAAAGGPFGLYANLGAPTPAGGRSEARSPEAFAREARGWVEAGARIVGGCCGTTPDHVAALAERLAS